MATATTIVKKNHRTAAPDPLKGGRHLAYERKTVTTGNLLLSIMDMYGVHQDKHGDSTGRLEKL